MSPYNGPRVIEPFADREKPGSILVNIRKPSAVFGRIGRSGDVERRPYQSDSRSVLAICDTIDDIADWIAGPSDAAKYH